MQLVKYEAARHALQEAKSIDEVKDIRDKVEALKSYARQRDDKDMEVWLSEIKLRADRRIGEISVDLDKLDRKESGLKKGSPNSGKTSKAATLKAAGISKSAAYRCEELSSLKEEEFEEVIK